MKKILIVLMCILLVPISLALEADPSDVVFSTAITGIAQYTALGTTDCSEFNNKCSTTGLNAYYYSCYRKTDGTCSCYLKYCADGYNCKDGTCQKACTTGDSWYCSGDYRAKSYTDANCNSKVVGTYWCGSGKTCKMDGTTPTCVTKCTSGTRYECDSTKNARVKLVINSNCDTSTYTYPCGSDEVCSDGQCIKEGKYIEGYFCPKDTTCKMVTTLGTTKYYFCSDFSPNKYKTAYRKVDGETTFLTYTCNSGYTCKAGDCVKLETGCSNPTAKVNEFYCKNGDIYKCASTNEWYLVKTFTCPSDSCKTSTPSTDYQSLCSAQTCSKSQYPDKCGADGKLYYNIHLSDNKCVYSVKSCPSGQECIGSKCIEKTCTKNSKTFQVGEGACFGNDFYTCKYDKTFNIDRNDQDCISCSDECPDENSRECFGDAFKVCGNYDEDKCLEWGDVNQCDEGCENGDCILPSCPKGMPTPPCAEAQWIDYPECFWDESACEGSDCGNEVIDADESCKTCPEDVICDPDEFCFDHTCILRAEVCDNEIDDDNDGLIDCNDEDCLDSEICESCSTGNTLKKRCPDSSTITTHNCINGEYKKTGNKCESGNGGIPNWVLPAVIGVLFVGGLIVILLTGKKKKRRKK